MRINVEDTRHYPQFNDAMRGAVVKVDGKVIENVIEFDTDEGYVLSHTAHLQENSSVAVVDVDSNGDPLVLKTIGQVTLEWSVLAQIKREMAKNPTQPTFPTHEEVMALQAKREAIHVAIDNASRGDISMEELMETAKRMRDKS